MAQARCPQCSTMVLVVPGARTVCPSCGYGAARKPAQAAAPAAKPQPAAAPKAEPKPEPAQGRRPMRPGERIALIAAIAGLVLLAAGVAAYSLLSG